MEQMFLISLLDKSGYLGPEIFDIFPKNGFVCT